jgi:hypothetical protein
MLANTPPTCSQPVTVTGARDKFVIATPMRFASTIRLNATGECEVVSMRWGWRNNENELHKNAGGFNRGADQ